MQEWNRSARNYRRSLAILFVVLLAGLATISCGGNAANRNSDLTAALTMSQLNVQFGNVPVNTSASQVLTFTNPVSSGLNVTVSSVVINGNGFSILQPPAVPLTLAPGQTGSITVQVLPTTAGPLTGTITITSSATPSTVTVNLTATGVTATPTTFSITGTISPAAQGVGTVVTVTNAGGTVDTATADSNGNYTLFVFANGTYTVTPSAPAGTTLFFTSASQLCVPAGSSCTVNVNGAAISGINFNVTANAPVPTITSLSPSSVVAGSAALTITINGSNFISTSTVTYNGSAHTATFVNGNTLTIQLTASDVLTAGSFPVVVTNPPPGGGASSAVNFTVIAPNPVPSITGFTPSSLGVGSAAQSIAVNGTNFVSGATVTFNGTAHQASFVSSTQLTLQLTAADLATTGSFPVVVTNPAPGGGVSQAANFSVTAGQLSGGPSPLTFGSVNVGTVTPSQTFTLMATVGSVIVNAPTVPAGFTVSGQTFPLTIAAGQSANLNVAFAPQNAGAASGNISFSSNASNTPTVAAVSGTGLAILNQNTAGLNFPSTAITTASAPQMVVLTAVGGDVTINSITPPSSSFNASGPNLPLTLHAGQNAAWNITFTPKSVGLTSSSVVINSTAANSPNTIGLSGTGTTSGSATLVASPNPLPAFASTTVGQSSAQQLVTLTANGGSVIINSASTTPNSGFVITSDPTNGGTTPVTITNGNSAQFGVTFTPTSAGAASDNLSVLSTATNSPHLVGLSGTGVAANNSQLTPSPSSLTFPDTNINSGSSQLPVTLTASSGSVTVNSATIAANSSPGFSVSAPIVGGVPTTMPVTIPSGQSVQFNVTFAPTNSGANSGSISFASSASNSPATVSLSGKGVVVNSTTLTFDKQSLTFPATNVGTQSAAQIVTATANNGSVTVSSALPTPGLGFNVTPQTATIPAGQTQQFSVTFTPNSAGPTPAASISIVSSASNSPGIVMLSGTGVAVNNATLTPNPNPTNLAFGNVSVGATCPSGTNPAQTITLVASGGNVSVSAPSMPPGYALNPAPTFPLAIASGQQAQLNVTFCPQSPGSSNGNISFPSDASNSPTLIGVTGAGFQTFSISGGLSAFASGATVSLTGAASAQVVADVSGNYSFTGLANGQYTITPTKAGVTFSPASQQVTVNNSNMSGINFVEVFTVSGSVSTSGAGATVTLSGAGSQGVVADGSGNYAFTGLPNCPPPGTPCYTITPTKPGYTFSPSSKAVSINNASVSGLNFTTLAGSLSINPSSTFSFGSVNVGTTGQLPATLSASGGDVTVTNDSITGAGFGLSAFNTGAITSGQSTPQFMVTFSPGTTGAVGGSLSFTSNATNNPSATLSGTGAGLNASPLNVPSFGSVPDATSSASKSVTLSAVGANVTINSATPGGSNPSVFSISGLPTLPFTITAGNTQIFNVTFNPASGSPGANAANVTFGSTSSINNFTLPAVVVTFSGTGTANVVLTWTDNQSGVTYNVYRCQVASGSCTPAQSNPIATGIQTMTYTDTSVTPGQTAFYAVSVVNAGGESALSATSNAAVIP